MQKAALDGLVRVYGWDLLRGLSALAVGVYHLLMWLGFVEWHSLGSYGVYLFFVLSGASLVYTYGGQFSEKSFVFWKFLGMRYARLAPLYILLMLLVLPWKIFKGGVTLSLAKIFLMNGFFVFGFIDPAINSMLIGGWSLGIEFVYYFLFPIIIYFVLKSNTSIIFLLLATVIQFWWIYHTIGSASGYAENATAFHHPQAFIAYFVGGCILGNMRRRRKGFIFPAYVSATFIVCGFFVIAALNLDGAGEELLGFRGVLGFLLCFFLVWVAGEADLKNRHANTAQIFGEATYGLYLIHPIVFFGMVWVVFPKIGISEPLLLTFASRLGVLIFVLIMSFLLALASERYFESPVRKRMKMLFS